MKKYFNPTLEIIEPSFEDILTTSGGPDIVDDGGNQTPALPLL